MEGLSDKEKLHGLCREDQGRPEGVGHSLDNSLCSGDMIAEPTKTKGQRTRLQLSGKTYQKGQFSPGEKNRCVEILRISRMKCKDVINHE